MYDDSMKKKLGNKIRDLRNINDISIDNVCKMLEDEGVEVDKSTISHMENGNRNKINAVVLVALSNIFNYNLFLELGLNVGLKEHEKYKKNEQYVLSLEKQLKDMKKKNEDIKTILKVLGDKLA